jgi:hypothetical protein
MKKIINMKETLQSGLAMKAKLATIILDKHGVQIKRLIGEMSELSNKLAKGGIEALGLESNALNQPVTTMYAKGVMLVLNSFTVDRLTVSRPTPQPSKTTYNICTEKARYCMQLIHSYILNQT